MWNHKSESYRNRLLRQSLLETLSSLLSDNEPVPFTGNNDGVSVVVLATGEVGCKHRETVPEQNIYRLVEPYLVD